MSDLLFGREVEVIFGKRGENGTSFTELRTAFRVEKTLESKPNKGEVKVYNLSKDSRSKAEQTGNVLILRAGYFGKLDTIYTGDVAKAKTDLDGSDYCTTFELGDGEQIFKVGRSETSFQAGTDVKKAVESILSQAGAKIGDITGLKPEKLQSSLVLSGNIRKHLDDLAVRQGFEWSIQDDKFQILPKGGATKEEAVLLSPETGLIGIPKNRFGKDSTERGIEFDSLLMGKIKAGRTVIIDSKFFQGKYRVEKVVHVGDTYGQEWFSRCEAVPL